MGFWDNQSQNPLLAYRDEVNQLTNAGLYNQLGNAYQQQELASILPNIMGTAGAQYQASQQYSPGYNDLMARLFSQYGGQLAGTGAQIGQQTQQAQANANAQVAGSAGGQAALNAAIAGDRAANPEFYAARAQEGQGLGNLLGSIDLSGKLSGGETEALNRSIAQQNMQTGTLNAPSAVNAASNAMQYGDATYKRQEQAKSDLSSALGEATSFLPASQSGVGGMNAWGIATGGPTTTTSSANAGMGLFQGPTNYSGLTNTANANNLSSILGNAMSGQTQLQGEYQRLNEGQPSGAQQVGAGLGVATSSMSSLGGMMGM